MKSTKVLAKMTWQDSDGRWHEKARQAWMDENNRVFIEVRDCDGWYRKEYVNWKVVQIIEE